MLNLVLNPFLEHSKSVRLHLLIWKLAMSNTEDVNKNSKSRKKKLK